MLTVPMPSTRVWRSVARTAPQHTPTLHRLTPSAVTRDRHASHDEDSDSCAIDCYAVTACCSCCAITRHCCSSTCRRCFVTAHVLSWYWKAILLFLLLLTTTQLYVNMAFYKNSKPLFSVNTTSAWFGNRTPLFKEQRQLSNQSWRGRSDRREVAHNWETDIEPASSKNSSNSSSNPHYPPRMVDPMSDRSSFGKNKTQEKSKNGNSSNTILRSIERSNELDVKNNSPSALPEAASGDGGQQRHVASSKNMTNMTTSVKHKSLLSDELPLCPPVPPDLLGHALPVTSKADISLEERQHPELLPGGRWSPPSCQSRHRVAVIIPYRSREEHLGVLLRHLHPFLQRQQLDYTIVVVEQAGLGKFNRAMLLNIGALEAVKLYPFQCFVFHDIDLLPEDDRNLYSCPQQPRHMSVAINTMGYKLPYNDLFGGVSALTVDHFRKVNGFSNKFWGWGGEDDDMSNRIKFHGLYISRYPASIARYTMLGHKKEKPNPQRYQYLYDGKRRFTKDGLNSAKHHVLDVQLRKLYTWLYVEPKQS